MPASGKIANDYFETDILPYLGYPRPEIRMGPAFGVDVSVIDLGNGISLAATSDPLSLIPSLGLQESAWLSVQLMVNDMATTGFAPMYAQVVLNLPPDLSRQDFKTYWQYIHRYCADAGVALTGGHTGRIDGQHSTIAGGGTMFLTAPGAQIRLSSQARPGDVLIVTKECALSATAILAMSFPETITQKLGKEIQQAGAGLFGQTSSLKDGLAAADAPNDASEVHAMHDVTEGGVLGAAYEMAFASGTGLVIYKDRLPVGPAQEQICRLFAIDPHCCIGAGAMLLAVAADRQDTVIARLAAQNIKSTVIGQMTGQQHTYQVITDDRVTPLIYGAQDPYWAAFFNAFKNGWK